MTITFFTTRLENFINETNATDENLLMLLSHLTDSIQSFVLAAKIIRTNHTIESVVDKSILSCENIFECLACNVQTGKTYSSVLNHINTTKHIAHVKQFGKHQKQQTSSKNLIVAAAAAAIATRSSHLINTVPATLQHFPNRELEMNPNHFIHGTNSQLPVTNGPFSFLQNHLSNLNRQAVVTLLPPIQRPVLLRPIVGIDHGLPINQIQSNVNNNFGVNNNTLVNGFMGHVNQLSMPEAMHYKEIFKMPLPTNVVGFQQNVISPSNNYLRNLSDLANEESDKDVSPAPVVKTRNRNRRQRKVRSKSKRNRTPEIDVKLLDDKTISFLMGNFEDQVVQYVHAAEKLSTDDLYTDITMNLKECCREMNFNVDVKCFGSRINGIGSTKSDVDMNITVTGEC